MCSWISGTLWQWNSHNCNLILNTRPSQSLWADTMAWWTNQAWLCHSSRCLQQTWPGGTNSWWIMPSKLKTVTNLAFMRHGENGFFDWKDYCSVSGSQGEIQFCHLCFHCSTPGWKKILMQMCCSFWTAIRKSWTALNKDNNKHSLRSNGKVYGC